MIQAFQLYTCFQFFLLTPHKRINTQQNLFKQIDLAYFTYICYLFSAAMEIILLVALFYKILFQRVQRVFLPIQIYGLGFLGRQSIDDGLVSSKAASHNYIWGGGTR